MNHNRIFRTMGGDGASQTVTRPKFRVFRSVTTDWEYHDGSIARVSVLVMSKRRWLDHEWAELEPKMVVIAAGPIVVGYKLDMYPSGVTPPEAEGKPITEKGGFL